MGVEIGGQSAFGKANQETAWRIARQRERDIATAKYRQALATKKRRAAAEALLFELGYSWDGTQWVKP